MGEKINMKDNNENEITIIVIHTAGKIEFRETNELYLFRSKLK